MPFTGKSLATLLCKHCGIAFCQATKSGRVIGYCTEECRKASKLVRDHRANPRIGNYHCTCGHCGNSFESRYKREYCSRLCDARAAIARRQPVLCKTCFAPIVRPIGRGMDRKYCSPGCVPKRYDAGHGYVSIFVPGHPLATKDGWVYEHRVNLYNVIGSGWHPCHWCNKPVTWDQHYNADGIGVDHVDFDRQHNGEANLVPSCRACNSNRRRKHGRTPNLNVLTLPKLTLLEMARHA